MTNQVVNWSGWLSRAIGGTFQIKHCGGGLGLFSQILYHCLTAENNFVATVRDFLGNHSVDIDYSIVGKDGELP